MKGGKEKEGRGRGGEEKVGEGWRGLKGKREKYRRFGLCKKIGNSLGREGGRGAG